jgi:CXXC-20-CXXC protein
MRMLMYKCKECSNKFHYKEILKSIWLKNYAPILCDKCNTKHYVSVSTRIILGIAIMSPLIIYNLLNLIFDEYIYYNVIIPYIIWLIIIVFLTPVYARYHIKTDEKKIDETKALLASNLNNTESEIIISILNSYEIPYLKKSKGSGELMEIYFGANNYGIDIYVPPEMLQIAKELINPNNIEEI